MTEHFRQPQLLRAESDQQRVEEGSRNPMSALSRGYQARIEEGCGHIGITTHAKNKLKMFVYATALVGVVIAPSINEALTQKLSLGEAINYAILSTVLGGATGQHVEPEVAKKFTATFTERRLPSEDDQAEIIKNLSEMFGNEWRRLLFNAGMFTVVVNAIRRVFEKRKDNANALKEGRAEIRRKGEQVFVVGGRSSNIADALTLASPQGIIPVFEGAGGGDYLTSKLDSVRSETPTFLNLDVNPEVGMTYRKSPEWSKLDIREENLLKSTTGDRYLVVVGCGEMAEEELGRDALSADVTQEELHTSVEMIRGQLEENGVHLEEQNVLTVYLGNAATPRIDDVTGRQTTTDREVAQKSGIHIYVDTWAVILRRIKDVLEQDGHNEAGVRLVSSVPEYRELIESVSREVQIPNHTVEDDPGNSLLMVYERLSDETLNRAKRLKREFPNRKIVALTSNIETDVDARDAGVETVCSAVVIRDVVQVIKDEIKKGTPPSEIQRNLDSYVAAGH